MLPPETNVSEVFLASIPCPPFFPMEKVYFCSVRALNLQDIQVKYLCKHYCDLNMHVSGCNRSELKRVCGREGCLFMRTLYLDKAYNLLLQQTYHQTICHAIYSLELSSVLNTRKRILLFFSPFVPFKLTVVVFFSWMQQDLAWLAYFDLFQLLLQSY